MSSDTNLSTSETAPSSANGNFGAAAAATQESSSASTPATDSSDATSPSSEPALAALSEPAAAATTTAEAEPQDETGAAAATPTTQAPVAPTTQAPVAPTTQAPVAPTPPAPPTPAAAAADAAIAERITIPGGHSNGDTSTSEGGEWELLTSKIKDWFDANDIGEKFNQARQPLRLLAYFIGLLMVLKVYSGLLGAIGTIPLAPRLLELVGLYSVISFAATRLVRSNDRREVIDSLRQRWSSFSGSKN